MSIPPKETTTFPGINALAHALTNMQQSIELLHGLLIRMDERIEHLIDQNSRIVDAYHEQQRKATDHASNGA